MTYSIILFSFLFVNFLHIRKARKFGPSELYNYIYNFTWDIDNFLDLGRESWGEFFV